jgi:hypothetical protein
MCPFGGVTVHPCKEHEFCIWGPDQFIHIYDRRMMTDVSGNDEYGRGEFFGTSGGGCLKKLKPSSMAACFSASTAGPHSVEYSCDGTEIVGSYEHGGIFLFCSQGNDCTEKKSFPRHCVSGYLIIDIFVIISMHFVVAVFFNRTFCCLTLIDGMFILIFFE